MRPVETVFFDVDFTLIYPGPTFEAEGYRRFCEKHGMEIEAERFEDAVQAASVVLSDAVVYDLELFVRYTRRIVEEMGGRGVGLEACAREIYAEWAVCQHFALYEDVAPTFQRLHAAGLKIGLISNTHRCLTSFQNHFELDGFVTAAISSSEHGYMKPHPSIFQAALQLVGAEASTAVMVGDSLEHDVQGALRVGMRGVLVARSGAELHEVDGVPIIRNLTELPSHLF